MNNMGYEKAGIPELEEGFFFVFGLSVFTLWIEFGSLE